LQAHHAAWATLIFRGDLVRDFIQPICSWFTEGLDTC